MYVSSQIVKANLALDYLLQDWQQAHLLKPSFARPKIAAVEPALVVYMVGTLSPRDLNGIDHCLLQALGLESALLATADLTVQSATFVQTLAEKSLVAAVARAHTDESYINLELLQEILIR
jgi:hypothetical protein